MGLLSSLFGGKKSESNPAEKQNKNFEILKYDGIRARNMGKSDYAIRCFEEAVALKEEPETLGLLANAYLRVGRTAEARTTLQRLTEREPDDANALLALANVCYMEEDYEAMNAACQKIIANDETNAPAYFLSARAYRGLKNDLQAIVMLTKAIMHNENFTEAYLLRADTLWEMKQAKDALEDVEKVLGFSTENEDAILLKGKIEAATGNIEAALECFNRVAELNPFNEKAYLLKGELQIKTKAFDDAVCTYTEAIELSPDTAQFYHERGRARLLAGDKDGAAEDLKRAIELSPEQENRISGSFKI